MPSASFNAQMTNWLAQPLPELATADDELLFLYTEVDTREVDREPIYQGLVCSTPIALAWR